MLVIFFSRKETGAESPHPIPARRGSKFSFFVLHKNFSVFVELVLVRNNIIEFNIIVSLSSQHNPLFAQVSENYGQVFYFKSKQERQRELEARYIK